MKKQTILYLSGGFILLLLIVWGFTSSEGDNLSDIIVQPTKGPFQVTVTVTGELQAKNSVEIYGPRGTARMRIYEMKISKLIPEGTVVKKGDFVAELDRTEINEKIKEAEVELQKAQSRYTQAKLDTTLTLSEARNELVNLYYKKEEMELQKENSAYEAPSIKRQAELNYEKAVRAYDQAKINYETKVQQAIAKMKEAEAELRQEQQKLASYQKILQQFTITAPADGMLIYAKEWNGRKIVVGSTIRAWDPVVAKLPDLSEMESVVYVNEVDIQKIKEDQRVEIGLDADPEKQLTGRVTEIANMGEQRPNSDSKVFEVVILVNEADSTLRPGMTTGNTIIVNELEEALAIPLECIHTEDSLTYVFKKSGFKTVKQEIRVGLVNENNAEVLAGLTGEDKIYLSTPEDGGQMKLSRLPEEEKVAKSEVATRQ